MVNSVSNHYRKNYNDYKKTSNGYKQNYDITNKYNIKDILLSKLNNASLCGNEIGARCPHPDHEDNRKSFSFNIKKLRGQCFGCGRAFTLKYIFKLLCIDSNDLIENEVFNENDFEYNFGNDRSEENIEVISLDNELMKMSILSTIESTFEEKAIKKTINYDYKKYINSHTKESIEFLKNRGFKDYDKVIQEFFIGYDVNKTYKVKSTDKTFRSPSITFPCITKGLCNYIQRRYTGKHPDIPRYLNMYGVNRNEVLFGYDFCDSQNSIIICEGPFNALTWLYLGFNAVAILGTSISQKQLNLLHGKTKICNFDVDIVGKRCYNKIKELSSDRVIDFLIEDDANDYLSKNKENQLIDMLYNVIN